MKNNHVEHDGLNFKPVTVPVLGKRKDKANLCFFHTLIVLWGRHESVSDFPNVPPPYKTGVCALLPGQATQATLYDVAEKGGGGEGPARFLVRLFQKVSRLNQRETSSEKATGVNLSLSLRLNGGCTFML